MIFMSVSMKKERSGGPERTPLVVVNPREEVIGRFSDMIVDAAMSYEGDVYRVENLDRVEDLQEFYDHEEKLADDPIYNDPERGGMWYDEFFVFDEDGVDEIDCKSILDNASTFHFAGGSLQDIGTLKNSIDEKASAPTSYTLNRHLTADYGGFNQDQGYVTNALMSLDDVIKNTPETLQDRLQKAGLNSENVDF